MYVVRSDETKQQMIKQNREIWAGDARGVDRQVAILNLVVRVNHTVKIRPEHSFERKICRNRSERGECFGQRVQLAQRPAGVHP